MHLATKKNIHFILSTLEPDTVLPLKPTDEDDLWNLYNLIQPGDHFTALTTRKVHHNAGGSSLGGEKSGESRREKVRLTISATNVVFEPAVNELRLSGPVVRKSSIVSLGQHHTLSVRAGDAGSSQQVISMSRPEGWDSFSRAALEKMLTTAKPDAIPAIIIQQGRGLLLNIREARTVVLAKVEESAAAAAARAKGDGRGGKTGGGDAKAAEKFHHRLFDALKTHVDLSHPPSKGLLLISPGFWASAFKDYLVRVAAEAKDKPLRAWATQADVVHTKSGLEIGLVRILDTPAVKKKLEGMHFSQGQEAVERFYDRLKRDEASAWYGKGAVERAVEAGAVGPGAGELLVLDELLRSLDLAVRRKWVDVVGKVRSDGGRVSVVGGQNPAGNSLRLLGGVAAVLTYPMEDLDEGLEDQDDKSEDDDGGDYVV